MRLVDRWLFIIRSMKPLCVTVMVESGFFCSCTPRKSATLSLYSIDRSLSCLRFSIIVSMSGEFGVGYDRVAVATL